MSIILALFEHSFSSYILINEPFCKRHSKHYAMKKGKPIESTKSKWEKYFQWKIKWKKKNKILNLNRWDSVKYIAHIPNTFI